MAECPCDKLRLSARIGALCAWIFWVGLGVAAWISLTAVQRVALPAVPLISFAFPADVIVILCQGATVQGGVAHARLNVLIGDEELCGNADYVVDLLKERRVLRENQIVGEGGHVSFIAIVEKKGSHIIVKGDEPVAIVPETIFQTFASRVIIGNKEEVHGSSPLFPIAAKWNIIALGETSGNPAADLVQRTAPLRKLADNVALLYPLTLSTRLVRDPHGAERILRSKPSLENLESVLSYASEWQPASVLAEPVQGPPPEERNFVVYFPKTADDEFWVENHGNVASRRHSFSIADWGFFASSPANVDDAEKLRYAAALLIPQIRSNVLGLPPVNLAHYLDRSLPPKSAEWLGFPVNFEFPKNSPLTSWELDRLIRTAALNYGQDALNSLESLTQLVRKQSGLIILPKVRDTMAGALEQLRLAEGKSTAAEKLKYTREASRLAKEALFDSSIVSLSYFGYDYRAALYLPLTLPFIAPLALILIDEWRAKRKQPNDLKMMDILSRSSCPAVDAAAAVAVWFKVTIREK